MSKEDRGLFAVLEESGIDVEDVLDTRSTLEKTHSGLVDITRGIYNFPTDMGAGGMNTMLDISNAVGLEGAIYDIAGKLYDVDTSDFEGRRFSGLTDIRKGDREVSGLEEGTSDLAGLMSGILISGGTSLGKNILSWGNKGGLSRRVVAEATTALPADVLLSDDSGEHLFFDDDKNEAVIKRRAKNIVENVGLGMAGDYLLRGISTTYRAIRNAGKTADDATQKVFNTDVAEGQADDISKVKPTAELEGDQKLKEVYEGNPMWKIDNRINIDKIVPQIWNQAETVSRAEASYIDGVQKNFNNVSETAFIPFKPDSIGLTTKETKSLELDALRGSQRRNEYLNMVDMLLSGKMTDKEEEMFTMDFLRGMTDPDDPDLLKILNGNLKGKERESAMRRVREKFANNPFLLGDENFKTKATISRFLSDKMGLTPKEPVNLFKHRSNYITLKKTGQQSPQFAKHLKKLSKDTGLDQDAILRNMASLNVVSEQMSMYMRGMTDIVDTHLKGLAKSSQELQKALSSKDSSSILNASKAWKDALGASLEVYEGVSGFKGNIGLALRSGREQGVDMKSWMNNFDELYVKKSRSEKSRETAKSYMRMAELQQKYSDNVARQSEIKSRGGSTAELVNLAKDAEKFSKEMMKMVKGTSTLDKAKKFVSNNYKREHQGLVDMFISMGISNLLASPATLGNIATSTANFVLFKQTLLPLYSGLINMISKGETGQKPIADVVRRWVGISRVAKRYLTTGSGEGMSRGIRGMQIEGQGFNQLSVKQLTEFINEKAGNEFTRAVGKLMVYPMWFGNQVMTRGIIPIDDFFRRVMLEAETESSIVTMYTKGIKTTDNVANKIASSFENFDEYHKTMLPLMTEVKNTIFKNRDASDEVGIKALNDVFAKYNVTRKDNDARASILQEVMLGETRAAEAVSQETTDDFVLGRVVKSALNSIESTGSGGRLVASTLVPFQTAPLNIMRSSFENTPLAPASARWRRKFASKGKQRNEAIAQVLSGMTVGLGAWNLVNSIPVYGHIPKEEISSAQQLGIQPYSFVIDGRSYSYNFLGTFKAPLAMLADFKRYGMDGANWESFEQAIGTFMLASGDNPYFDSMQQITSIISGEGTTKDLARFVASKGTQFLQIGSGLDRTYDAILGNEMETSAMNTYYDNVWLRELDVRNKDNPMYRFFRDMVDPKAYVNKTNIFGESIIRNGGGAEGLIPYMLGASNMPAPTSPGIVMLKELDLVNRDWTTIGDVEISGHRSKELKERVFSDSGLGLKRLLDAYATNPTFMSASDSYRKQILSKLINDHVSKVESTMGLDIVSKQLEFDRINDMLDYDSRGAEIELKVKSDELVDIIYQVDRNGRRKGSIKRDRLLEIYE